jgi:hypothetical protein
VTRVATFSAGCLLLAFATLGVFAGYTSMQPGSRTDSAWTDCPRLVRLGREPVSAASPPTGLTCQCGTGGRLS